MAFVPLFQQLLLYIEHGSSLTLFKPQYMEENEKHEKMKNGHSETLPGQG